MEYFICAIVLFAVIYAIYIAIEEHHRMRNPHVRISEIEYPTHKLSDTERERINEIYYKELMKLKGQGKDNESDTI